MRIRFWKRTKSSSEDHAEIRPESDQQESDRTSEKQRLQDSEKHTRIRQWLDTSRHPEVVSPAEELALSDRHARSKKSTRRTEGAEQKHGVQSCEHRSNLESVQDELSKLFSTTLHFVKQQAQSAFTLIDPIRAGMIQGSLCTSHR